MMGRKKWERKITGRLWSKQRDLNPRPRDPKSRALPTALRLDVECQTGLEPATACLEGRGSTIELLAQVFV